MNLFRFQYDRTLPVSETRTLHSLQNQKELPEAVSFLGQVDSEGVKVILLSERVRLFVAAKTSG